jgi:pilus assembly protein Flp/PilA
MIAGLIAAAIAATIKALGTDLTNVFNTICGAIKGGTATTC